MKKILLTTLLTILVVPVTSFAASFDCTKAASLTEKLICGDESISKLDEQLAASYKTALENATDKDAFNKTQIEWLKQQRACKDVECLSKSYQSRLGELNQPVAVKPENNNASSSIAFGGSKNLLHFTLVEGEGYPICKDYVEMLNATKYADTRELACSRKNLPEFKQFKSLDWTEITDKGEMEKVIRARSAVKVALHPNTSASVYSPYYSVNLIKQNKLKLFMFEMDINGDGVADIVYRSRIVPPFEAEKSGLCNHLDSFEVDDSKLSLQTINETAKDPYHFFGITGSNELFLYHDDLYFSSWAGNSWYKSNLDIYAMARGRICKVLAQ